MRLAARQDDDGPGSDRELTAHLDYNPRWKLLKPRASGALELERMTCRREAGDTTAAEDLDGGYYNPRCVCGEHYLIITSYRHALLAQWSLYARSFTDSPAVQG